MIFARDKSSLSHIKSIFLLLSKMVLFLAIINDITATSGVEPRFHVAAESKLAVGPIWRCSRPWNCRDFLYFHLELNSNWLMMRKLLLQLVQGPTVKCLN